MVKSLVGMLAYHYSSNIYIVFEEKSDPAYRNVFIILDTELLSKFGSLSSLDFGHLLLHCFLKLI